MNRITITTELAAVGQHAVAVVTREHILVSIDDRACIAHRDWFDRAEAAEMAQSLTAFATAEPAELRQP